MSTGQLNYVAYGIYVIALPYGLVPMDFNVTDLLIPECSSYNKTNSSSGGNGTQPSNGTTPSNGT